MSSTPYQRVFGANNGAASGGASFAPTLVNGTVDGVLQAQKSDGTFASLLLGASGAATGVKLVPSANALTIAGGDGAANVVVTIAAVAGNNAFSTLGAGTWGELNVTRTTGDAFKLNPAVNGRISSDSQFGFASGSAVSTSRDVSFYRSAAGVIGVNNGSGTSPNGSLALLALLVGAASCKASSGSATPNSAVTGSPGDIYLCTTGGAATTLWVKESGSTTNTGWVGK